MTATTTYANGLTMQCEQRQVILVDVRKGRDSGVRTRYGCSVPGGLYERCPTVAGMSGPGEGAEHEARTRDAQRWSRELVAERLRLHRRLLETAESVRRSHEHTAEMMERLAETGPAEHASRRRRAAAWSRGLAEEEARQIAKLKGPRFLRGTDGCGIEVRSDTDRS
jgi:hypothetical protein